MTVVIYNICNNVRKGVKRMCFIIPSSRDVSTVLNYVENDTTISLKGMLG